MAGGRRQAFAPMPHGVEHAKIDDQARDLVRTLLPPDMVRLLQRIELATTADGRPRVDRAFGVLAIEAMPVYAGDQVQAPPGSGYDSVNDALGGASGTYAPIASPTFTGTVTAADVASTGNTTLGNADADTATVWGHLLLKGTAPTIANGVAIGTGGSVGTTIAGCDRVGSLTIRAGTTSLTTGRLATVSIGGTAL